MAAKTKPHLRLDKEQTTTAANWLSFVSDRVDADSLVFNKIQSSPVLVDIRDCEIMTRWWNYLPGYMVDESDKDLFDLIYGFLYY